MKKTFLLLGATLMSLASCGQQIKLTLDDIIYTRGDHQETIYERLGVKVVAPTGAPAVSLYHFVDDLNGNLTTSSNPDAAIIPMFQNNNYDVIVAPTDRGLNQIINLGAQYRIAATITFGNFYIVSMGTDTDNTLNKGDKVIIFQENGVPGKTFKYLYGDLGLTTTAVAAASDTKLILENNGVFDGVQYDYVLTAEPVMSASGKTAFINIQDAFKEKSGGKLMTQASVFVNTNSNRGNLDRFLYALEDYINDGLKNPDLIKTSIEKVGSVQAQQTAFGVPGAMAKKVTAANNGLGLGYKSASDIKADIRAFIGVISPDLHL